MPHQDASVWAAPRAGGSTAASPHSTMICKSRGASLCLRQGKAPEILAALIEETGACAIHVTSGYEPWEPELEKAISQVCRARGAEFRAFGGQLLFEPEAIVTGDGKPYRIFSPFWKACLAADPPRAPLPAPKRMRFADARSDRLEALKLLPTRPDWAEGLRDTWQPGEAAASRDSASSSRIDWRTTQTSKPARYRRDIASIAASPFRRDQPKPDLACRRPRRHCQRSGRSRRRVLSPRTRLARILLSSAASLSEDAV